MKKTIFLLSITVFLLGAFTQSAFGEQSAVKVSQVQEQLIKGGFDPGPADGLIGPKTIKALRQYQAKHGLPETGLLDENTLNALGIQEAASKPTSKQIIPTSLLSSLKTPDWVRLTLLVILGLGAFSLLDCLAGIILGALAAFGLYKFAGWPWPLCLQVSLAAIFVLPLLFRMLRLNFRMIILFALIAGVPTFLISKYIFDSTWIFAAADGVALMCLAPSAIIRILTATGLIEKLSRYLKLKYITTNHPELLEATLKRPGLLETIKDKPEILIDLEGYPALFTVIKENPMFINFIIKCPKGFHSAIDKDKFFMKIFKKDPDILEKIGKSSSYKKILEIVKSTPEIIALIKQKTIFFEMIEYDSTLRQTIKRHPDIVRTFKSHPKLLNKFELNLKEIRNNPIPIPIPIPIKNECLSAEVTEMISREFPLSSPALEFEEALKTHTLSSHAFVIEEALKTYTSLILMQRTEDHLELQKRHTISSDAPRMTSSSPISSR